MRLLETGTKYFDINSYNVPKLDNTWGCMIDFFDTVLVNGSESQEILSITIQEDLKYPDLYWIATLTINPGHGFKENCSVIKISDSSSPDYNNLFRVQEVTDNTLNIAFSKTEYPIKPSAVDYTFGMTLTLPPLGYEKVFSGEQKAVYKVTTKEDKYCYLRVDNSCPEGHDPSWAKFSRLSMLSEIDSIEDYRFRLGRSKAPAYLDDYNRTEENIYDVWFSTRYYNNRYFYFKQASNRPTQKFYMLAGDSETFYLMIDSLRDYSNTTEEDNTYVFGKYTKLIYKEDSLPFLLRCSRRDSETSDNFVDYANYASLTRDRTIGRHTFKTEVEDIFTTSTSQSWALWLNDSFHSGVNTRVNFKPYKNELNINLVDMNLRFYRDSNVVLEGRLRGLKHIIGNLQDFPAKAPAHYSIFLQDNKHYIRVPDRDYYEQASYALLLNDWE